MTAVDGTFASAYYCKVCMTFKPRESFTNSSCFLAGSKYNICDKCKINNSKCDKLFITIKKINEVKTGVVKTGVVETKRCTCCREFQLTDKFSKSQLKKELPTCISCIKNKSDVEKEIMETRKELKRIPGLN